ncbi:MAG: non-ribosomal peptide synthetase, partial [Oscillospiraceae bacterium]|nr:non-ribosomal peptide synthetase [Oscillospiraceae bacterium]
MADNYSKALSLIEKLEKKGVSLWKENDKIKFKANTGALQPEDLAELKQMKSELLELLDPENRKMNLIENKSERFQPFVLTDVQQSYLMGRSNLFDYGGLACHIYLQLNYDRLDVQKVEEIWNYLIERHEMLRAVIHEEGYQQILEKAPHLTVTDYQDMPAEKVMEQMGHQQFKIGSWPYFGVGVSNYENSAIMHFSIEFIIADWTSIWMLLHQFEELYFGRISEIPEIDVSFRDYVIAEKELKESAACERDRHYWLSRMEDFPLCPQIDIEPYSAEKEARFDRKSLQLSPELWENVKNFAYQCNVTPTALVLMAYAHTLSCYSENKRFTINLTMLNRQPLHKNIGKVIGDFTSLTLLDINLDNDDSFIENVKRTNMRLFEDMDHNLYSGVSFMRELANKKGSAAASMPYVFTSAVGLLSSMDNETVSGMVSGIGISQTPQVFIDCQVMDGSFGMQVNWDVRRGVFKDGMIE